MCKDLKEKQTVCSDNENDEDIDSEIAGVLLNYFTDL